MADEIRPDFISTLCNAFTLAACKRMHDQPQDAPSLVFNPDETQIDRERIALLVFCLIKFSTAAKVT